MGVRTSFRNSAPDCCSSGSTFFWLPLVSSSIPMVSGRFFSCVKFLIVCGVLSSSRLQSSLCRFVMKPPLSRCGEVDVHQVHLQLQGLGRPGSARRRPGRRSRAAARRATGASWAEGRGNRKSGKSERKQGRRQTERAHISIRRQNWRPVSGKEDFARLVRRWERVRPCKPLEHNVYPTSCVEQVACLMTLGRQTGSLEARRYG